MAVAIKEAQPNSFVGWIIEDRFAELICDHPAVDRVFAVPREILKRPRRLASLLCSLRKHRFEVVLDPQTRTRSGVLSLLSGVRERIGFSSPQGAELGPFFTKKRIEPKKSHMVDRYVELLAEVGISPSAIRFDLGHSASNRHQINGWRQSKGLGLRNYLVLSSHATNPDRRWPPKMLGALARRIGEERGMQSVLAWHGEQERAWCQEALADSGEFATLAPCTSISQLIELLRGARGFVGTDSAPLHLAAASGIPCIGIFGPTCPTRSGPYGSNHICVTPIDVFDSRESRHSATVGSSISQVDFESVVNATLSHPPIWHSSQMALDGVLHAC